MENLAANPLTDPTESGSPAPAEISEAGTGNGQGAGAAPGMEETNTTGTPPEPPAAAANSGDDVTQTQAFARRLKERSEQEAQRLAQERVDEFYRQMYAGQQNPYTGRPIESEADYREYEQQHQLAQLAAQNGVTIEQQREMLRQAMTQDPVFRATQEKARKLEQVLVNEAMERDLAEIRAHNPQETAKSVEELGPTYLNCIRLGMDAVTAYEVARQEKARLNPAPPSMGDVGGGGSSGPDCYTREEVAAMTQQQVHDNWEKIQRSRQHWK